MPRSQRHHRKPSLEGLEQRLVLSGYSPTQIKTAYGLSTIGFTTTGGQAVAADGSGETIAVVVGFHDPYLVSDLHTFDARYNLPDPVVNQINLAGQATDDGWAGEETLDVEWAHAIAPGAKIVVVESATDNTTDLLAGVAVARNTPGVVAVSMSWGGPELANETAYDSTYFTTPAGHTGITFITASGDNGASGGAEWPASSPDVLSVGGTTLSTGANGAYGGESAWNGSGVGISHYENEPSYQAKIQSTGKHTVPDVSFLGDPNTGVDVYTTNPSNGAGSWSTVGGTSLGSPAWAGIMAIIDEGLNLSGTPSLDGATQTLPKLYALAGAQSYENVANSLVSVRTGSSGGGGFRRGGGGSFVSISSVGLGSPIGTGLVAALVRNTTAIAPPAPPPSIAVARAEVQKLYQTILNRPADPTGLAACVNAIENGTSPAQIAAGLLHSAEYDTSLVIQAYQTDLGRSPNSTDLAASVAALQHGESLTDFNTALLTSLEFNVNHTGNASFIQAAYQATLGRTASTVEVANVAAAFSHGLSRFQLIKLLLTSAEAYIATINATYVAYLGRLPETSAVDACLGMFRGGSLNAISLAQSLAGSAEFQANA